MLTKILSVVLSIALVLQASVICLAEKPEVPVKFADKLPEETIGLIHLSNLPNIIERIESSPFYKAFSGMKFPEELETENPQIKEVRKTISEWTKLFPKIFPGEITFALLDVKKGDEIPRLIFLADVNRKEFDSFIDKQLKPLLEKSGKKIVFGVVDGIKTIGLEKEPKVFYKIDGNTLILSFREDTIKGFLKGVKTPLSKHPVFIDALKKTEPGKDLLLYVNIQRIYDVIGEDIDEETSRILTALGLLNLQSFVASARLIEDGTVSTIAITAKDELRGIFKLAYQPGSEPASVKYVPADYSFYVRFSFSSFLDLWNNFLTIVEDVAGEEDLEEFAEAISDFEKEFKIDIEQDILKSLGGEFSIAVKFPDLMGIPEVAAFVEVKTKEKIEKIISQLLPEGIELLTDEYKGIEIKSQIVGMIQPGFAFVDNYLVGGIAPTVIKKIIDTSKTGQSLLTSKDYQTVYSHLPKKGVVMTYTDTKKLFNFIFSAIFMAISRRAADREMRVKFINEIKKAMEQAPGKGSVLVADKRTITIKGFSGIAGTGVVTLTLAGMLLPALVRAREQARRIACANNIKQLMLAQHLYAVDHDGKFADNFSDLYPAYVDGFSIFKCPSAKNKRITKKEEIDTLTDYVLRKGFKETDPATTILIYEKLGNHRGDGCNCGYIDGHVKWMPIHRMKELIESNFKTEE